jgi:hypothetical protein
MNMLILEAVALIIAAKPGKDAGVSEEFRRG